MANVIDVIRNILPSTRTLDISGESYGYIVSHGYYGEYNYGVNSTRTLILANLSESRVEITFEHFEIASQPPCGDYIEITKHPKICGASQPPPPFTIDLEKNERDIAFTFYTDGLHVRKGFWLLYKSKRLL